MLAVSIAMHTAPALLALGAVQFLHEGSQSGEHLLRLRVGITARR